jgi:hypothetical protein
MQASVTLTDRASTSMTPTRLDELLGLSASSLSDLYADARVPRLDRVSGALEGRMLAWPGVRGAPARFLRAFAASSRFPWRGKSFAPRGGSGGEGINRVFVDRLRLFRFETYIARSRAGDFDALQLDYDLPENPWFIRRIKDEMRELRPGLWLGQAYWHTARSDRLVLYFGLASS